MILKMKMGFTVITCTIFPINITYDSRMFLFLRFLRFFLLLRFWELSECFFTFLRSNSFSKFINNSVSDSMSSRWSINCFCIIVYNCMSPTLWFWKLQNFWNTTLWPWSMWLPARWSMWIWSAAVRIRSMRICVAVRAHVVHINGAEAVGWAQIIGSDALLIQSA